MNQKITKQSIAIGEAERKVVNEFREVRGLNFSAALRFIINEWRDFKAHQAEEQVRITEAGIKALAGEKQTE